MDLTALDDRQLLDRQRALAADRRRIDAEAAAVAAEIAHRSRRELGHSGLAQGSGCAPPNVSCSSSRRCRPTTRA